MLEKIIIAVVATTLVGIGAWLIRSLFLLRPKVRITYSRGGGQSDVGTDTQLTITWNYNLGFTNITKYEDAVEAANGAGDIGAFLGYWFIRKAMWASKTAIKENAASLKKFYQFMLEAGKISNQALEELKLMTKEEMPDWLATMERYDDPDIEDMEEVWGI